MVIGISKTVYLNSDILKKLKIKAQQEGRSLSYILNRELVKGLEGKND